MLSIFQQALQIYIDHSYVGTTLDQVKDGVIGPAPPLGKGSRAAWKPYFNLGGPVGILLVNLHEVGAGMDREGVLRSCGEVPIETLDCPWQSLRATVQDLGRRARTEIAQGSRRENGELHEIDREATIIKHGDLSADEHHLLGRFMHGAAWSKSKFQKTGFVEGDDIVCDLCGEEMHTFGHIVFDCCALNFESQQVDEELALIPTHMLPACVRIGIAPRMSALPTCSYWGNVVEQDDEEFAICVAKNSTFSNTADKKKREIELDQ